MNASTTRPVHALAGLALALTALWPAVAPEAAAADETAQAGPAPGGAGPGRLPLERHP